MRWLQRINKAPGLTARRRTPEAKGRDRRGSFEYKAYSSGSAKLFGHKLTHAEQFQEWYGHPCIHNKPKQIREPRLRR